MNVAEVGRAALVRRGGEPRELVVGDDVGELAEPLASAPRERVHAGADHVLAEVRQARPHAIERAYERTAILVGDDRTRRGDEHRRIVAEQRSHVANGLGGELDVGIDVEARERRGMRDRRG